MMHGWTAHLLNKVLDKQNHYLYNASVTVKWRKTMVYQKETLNKIATLRYCGKSVEFIAAALGLVATDVAAALKAFKL